MQKRRQNTTTTALPSTHLPPPPKMDDDFRVQRGSKGDGSPYSSACGPQFWSFMVLVMIALLIVFCIQQFTAPTTTLSPNDHQFSAAAAASASSHSTARELLPFSQFPTLNYALEHADLVGLYFAASWCPMSAGPTKLLGATLPDRVLLPPPDRFIDQDRRYPFAVVYVGSDRDQESMDAYLRPYDRWIAIPIEEGSDERIALKKHFQTCAREELAELHIERKQEIPALFVLDGTTHGILSSWGIKDMTAKQNGETGQGETATDNPKVLEHWKQLQKVVRGFEDRIN